MTIAKNTYEAALATLRIGLSLAILGSSLWGQEIPLQDLKLTADQMECRPQENVCTATGNALAVHGKKVMQAHRLTAYFTSKKKGAPTTTTPSPMDLSSLLAEQGVVFKDPEHDLIVKADKLQYDIAHSQLELTGNVRITRGSNQLNGARGTVNLKDGVFRLYAQTDASRKAGVPQGMPVEALISSLPSMKRKS